MITKEKIEQFGKLESEKFELQSELKRINGFNERDSDNKDNMRAIDKGHIFVKFAGTACNLPIGIFTSELNKRKKSIDDRLIEIETELTNL